MVIDIHVHPINYSSISRNREEVDFRRRVFVRKYTETNASPIALSGKPSGGNPFNHGSEEVTFQQMGSFGIDRLVLMPLDLTTTAGGWVVSNEQIKSLVDLAPDRFIGFASVDPRRKDVLQVLDYAFGELGLSGLKLNPSKQAFYPQDPMMIPIYKKCIEYNKPIMFHAGLSLEPDCLAKYSQPVNFEEVAMQYPDLRICLAHFGFPWVYETAMLLLKYPNVYTDTSAIYMDSPERFMDQVFNRMWGPLWFEHNFPDKVMFGSNNPRFRSQRIIRGLDSIQMRDSTRKKLMGKNALRFLGLEE